MYTPIRTDEEDVSIDQVFFGGINVYLQQKIPLFRHLPAFADRFLDAPWLIRWATSRGMETSAKELGALTVSMLKGSSGYQRKEVRKLCDWLGNHVHPHLINLTNMLVAGCVPTLREKLQVPVVVTLQGDDIFLQDLIPPYYDQAMKLMRELVPHIDLFIVFSQYYAEMMSEFLGIPHEKIRIVPLGMDVVGFPESPRTQATAGPPTVGYLARLAPEKGLHVLVDAFLLLKRMPGMENCRLKIAGWLGNDRKSYAEEQFSRLRQAGWAEDFEYLGVIDRQEKIDFLTSLDLFSVPTTYREPKGLFVLEALAAGTPVVQPNHGAFPELLARTGGGLLSEPDNPRDLAECMARLLGQPEQARTLGNTGQLYVHSQANADRMADATWEAYQSLLESP